VAKVDERRRAVAAALILLRAGGRTLGDEPEPGLVIDDLHAVARVKLLPHLHRARVALVPVAEMDEDAPEVIALGAGLSNHVDALDKPKLEAVEDRADPLLGDVLEDPGNAEGVDDRLGLAPRALLLLLGGRVRGRHYEVKVCFENGLAGVADV